VNCSDNFPPDHHNKMFARNSAMERVLSTPELLDIVFGMLDQPSNATNAQVCKRWSRCAVEGCG